MIPVEKRPKPRVCLCVLGWIGPHRYQFVVPENYSLISTVLPSFFDTVKLDARR